MTQIRKAAVIGAGVMGSGIAAHLANAGVSVTLLDIEKTAAQAGVTRQLKAGGFMSSDFAARVTVGSTTDDLHLLADADWIIEAVAERLDVKQSLFRAIEGVRRPGSVVSSNTSTIPLATLMQGLPDTLAQDFLITHFFNPPRRMRLLELVGGAYTRPGALEMIADFADRQLGKQVVKCKDTPGFIANRIGNYWMAVALNQAISRGLAVEDADAALSRPFGIPKTGIFGLMDLVGIDLMPMVLRSLQAALPGTDAFNACDAEPPLLTRMIAAGQIGRKAGGGFTRVSPAREVMDLTTGAYRPARAAVTVTADARALMQDPSPIGEYVHAVMTQALAYAAALVPDISDTPDAVDAAMRTGYGWAEGPFEMMDRIGTGWLAEQLTEVPPYLALAAAQGGFYHVRDGQRMALLPDGSLRAVPVPVGVITLATLALRTPPVRVWPDATLWDMGDGVTCFQARTKMGTFSPALLDALEETLEHTQGALVIGHDGAVFSAGADLREFLAMGQQPGALGAFIARGQSLFRRMKYAPVPVVGAPAGLALGGGCEILLHCDAIQAHADLAIGLVETRIGVIPGWGGTKELMLRTRDPQAVFRFIMAAQMSASAFAAPMLLRATDGVTMNRDRVLADARARALALMPGYTPPAPPAPVPASDPAPLWAVLETLSPTAHDRVVAGALIKVLAAGGSEEELLAGEQQAFTDLFGTPETVARVRHMLETGKPLRN